MSTTIRLTIRLIRLTISLITLMITLIALMFVRRGIGGNAIDVQAGREACIFYFNGTCAISGQFLV